MCPLCIQKLQSSRIHFDGVPLHIAAVNHDFVQVVAVWKDQRARYLTHILAHQSVRALPFRASGLLVPIPIRRRSHIKRGWDPLLDLSVAISVHSQLEVSKDLLLWKREPNEQRGLSNSQRAENMKDKFAVSRTETRGVWLLDDVLTSGATLRSAVSALRKAEVAVAGCLVLAAPRMRHLMHD